MNHIGIFAPDPKLDWNTQETFRLLKGAPGTVYQECSETEKHVYRDWVRALLRNQAIVVSFTKGDGTLREMRCTLNFDLIPEDRHPKAGQVTDGLIEHKHKPPREEGTQSVFDLDKNEWRSFRYERVRKISADIHLG